MASSRLKNLSKLALLLGTPAALLMALFAGGVHYGQTHRAAVLGFERDWLGMDVIVPEAPPEPVTPKPVTPEPAKPLTPETPKPVAPEPTPTTPITPTPTTPTPTTPSQPEPAHPVTQPTSATPVALATVTDPSPLKLAPPEPLPADLQTRLAEPVRVRVKVLVDPELFARRPDWIAYVQRHVEWASKILDAQIGMQLELRGVGVWSLPLYEDAETAIAELEKRSREGADLLLPFFDQPFPGPVAISPGANYNHAFMPVFSDPGSPAPHLRGLLHAIGQSLGAAPVSPDSEAWEQGSWMGEVSGTRSDRTITLDAASRRTMLEHKMLKFIAAPTARDTPRSP